MGKLAVDFGTSNTVICCRSEASGRYETVSIRGVSRAYEYRLDAAAEPESRIVRADHERRLHGARLPDLHRPGLRPGPDLSVATPSCRRPWDAVVRAHLLRMIRESLLMLDSAK